MLARRFQRSTVKHRLRNLRSRPKMEACEIWSYDQRFKRQRKHCMLRADWRDSNDDKSIKKIKTLTRRRILWRSVSCGFPSANLP
jgi:hypothetical protein